MYPEQNVIPNDVVEKPRKKEVKKDDPSKKYHEPDLPSAPPKDKPDTGTTKKPAPPQPEKRPEGPVEDNNTPDEFITKKKLKKETRKIKESEHL